jgi:hypothetical protein
VLCQAGQAWSPLTQQHASAACQQLLRLPTAAMELSAAACWQLQSSLKDCAPTHLQLQRSVCASAFMCAPSIEFSPGAAVEACCCLVCLQYVYLAVAKPNGVLEHTIEQLCSTSFTLAIKVSSNGPVSSPPAPPFLVDPRQLGCS